MRPKFWGAVSYRWVSPCAETIAPPANPCRMLLRGRTKEGMKDVWLVTWLVRDAAILHCAERGRVRPSNDVINNGNNFTSSDESAHKHMYRGAVERSAAIATRTSDPWG